MAIVESLPNTGAHNAIVASTTINGDIAAEEDFRLDGTLVGNISVGGKLIIGPAGSVKGNVACENLELNGVIIGNVKVGNLVTLRETAVLDGELILSQLFIEPGARFNGNCTMR